MKITQITVSYGQTQSLPEYSNVKPNLTITATIYPDEDPTEIEHMLWAWARDSVHAQIDSALEANGKAARYDPAPRYQVLHTYWNKWDHRGEAEPPQYVIILPNGVDLDRDEYVQMVLAGHYSGDARKLRYAHARQIAAEVLQDPRYTLLDCANGDLEQLAVLRKPAAPPVESNPDAAPTPDSPF